MESDQIDSSSVALKPDQEVNVQAFEARLKEFESNRDKANIKL